MLFLLRLAARLPLPLLHALGAALGWMVYLCSPRYRRDFKRNLALAGLSDFRRAAVADGASRGKGLIVVTPHIGCWEIVGQSIASRMPITVMYSPPKMKLFEPL